MRTNAPRGIRQSTLAMAVATALVPLPSMAATFLVSNNAASGPGSLTQAILDANTACTAGPHTIQFSGPHVIAQSSTLPAISCGAVSAYDVTIEGGGGTIDGASLAYGSCLLDFSHFYGGTVVVRNTRVTNFIAGAGVCVRAPQNGFVSTLQVDTGSVLSGNNVGIHGPYGSTGTVHVNVVDSTLTGNSGHGIYTEATGNTTVSGSSITGSSSGIYTYINGTLSVINSSVSGNSYEGIYSSATTTLVRGSTITGNVVGIDVNENGTIGGSSPADRNIISGNADIGVYVSYAGTVSIEGNYIGTNATGNVSGGAQAVGVYLEGNYAPSVINNVISGNGTGIEMWYPSYSGPKTVVNGNLIGPGAGNENIGNVGGIYVSSEYDAYGGGMVDIVYNTIKLNNGLSGVQVYYGGGVQIRENSIYNNAPKNIDLNVGQALPNDVGDIDVGDPFLGGGNQLQNHPVITSVIHRAGGTQVTFTFDSHPGSYQAQMFANAAAGIPGGEVFLTPHFFSVTGGPVTQTFSLPGLHDFISLTAINMSLTGGPNNYAIGDTSEFSPIRPLDGSSAVSITPAAPTALSFPSVTIGTTSATQTVTFTSAGTVPWTINSWGTPTCSGQQVLSESLRKRVSSAAVLAQAAPYGGPLCDGTEFVCTTDCVNNSPYNQGLSCTLTVAFAPTALGNQSTTVQFCDDAAQGSPRDITITGTAVPPPPPTITSSIAQLDFGPVVVGTPSAPQNVAFTTTGTTPWTISNLGSPTCTGGAICSGGPFTCSTTCATGSPYSSGASCTLTATFTPTVTGSASTTVEFCDNATGSPRAFTITGTGVPPGPPPTPPTVVVTPPNLSFGDIQVGSSSALSAELKNVGELPWMITSMGSPSCYGGPVCYGGSDFSCTTTCATGTSYSQGGSCTLTATFAPTSPGPKSVNVEFCDNATGSPRILTITGNGATPPGISLSPTGFSFGNVVVGANSATSTFAVSNLSSSVVDLGGPVVTAPFVIKGSSCAATLPAGGSCQVQVGFAPTAEGYYSGTLSFSAMSGTAASLSGTAIRGARLVASPTSVLFPSFSPGSTPPTRSVTLTNAGQQPFRITEVRTASPFSVAHNCPTTPLPPEGSCVADLTFSPTSLGDVAGELVVTGDGPATSVIVPLRGSAQAAPTPRLEISPTAISFGARGIYVPSVTQTVRVRNVGGSPALIDSLVTSADFVVLGHNCLAPLGPLAECSADVQMLAQGFGPRAGTLTVRSNAEGSPHVVNLSGSGCRPAGFTAGRFGSSGNSCAP